MSVQVADQQAALLERGIGNIYVSLAGRNQVLLDDQIAYIDQLERAEQDADRLENLFRLDHLATRMRRNAESLLVLAGANPQRGRGRPVRLADVVRAAVSEVDQYQRIRIISLEAVTVDSNLGVDLAHLLAELMENATQYSPPDSTVEVTGHLLGEHGYALGVADAGGGCHRPS